METKLIKELKCIVFFNDTRLFKDILNGFELAKVRVLKVDNEGHYLNQIQTFQPQFTILEIDPQNAKHTFSLIEKHRQYYQNKFPIFLIGNSTDTSLILQGLELGATDFFQRPLDFDLVATKIGKYFFHEELQKRGISYIKVPLGVRKAELELPITILSIDERGLVMQSPHTISKGAKLNLGESLLKELLGLEELIVTVEKTQVNSNKEEIFYATFPEDEIYSTAVRRFILELKKGEKTTEFGAA